MAASSPGGATDSAYSVLLIGARLQRSPVYGMGGQISWTVLSRGEHLPVRRAALAPRLRQYLGDRPAGQPGGGPDILVLGLRGHDNLAEQAAFDAHPGPGDGHGDLIPVQRAALHRGDPHTEGRGLPEHGLAD